jgi:hypothetical protein
VFKAEVCDGRVIYLVGSCYYYCAPHADPDDVVNRLHTDYIAAFTARFNGTLRSESKIQHEGCPGRATTITGVNREVEIPVVSYGRKFLAGDRLYVLSVSAEDGVAHEDNVEKFFSSFQMLVAPEAAKPQHESEHPAP